MELFVGGNQIGATYGDTKQHTRAYPPRLHPNEHGDEVSEPVRSLQYPSGQMKFGPAYHGHTYPPGNIPQYQQSYAWDLEHDQVPRQQHQPATQSTNHTCIDLRSRQAGYCGVRGYFVKAESIEETTKWYRNGHKNAGIEYTFDDLEEEYAEGQELKVSNPSVEF
jgi:hypothetical protein